MVEKKFLEMSRGIVSPAEYERKSREYFVKHADEPQPRDAGRPFTFGLVTRTYRELSNGNLTNRLNSLLVQQISSDEYQAYVAVNNPRVWALAADVYAENEGEFTGADDEKRAKLLLLVGQRYAALGHKNFGEEGRLLMVEDSWESVQTRIQDYRENQATLGILGHLTNAVTKISEEEADQAAVIGETLHAIDILGRDFLREHQREALKKSAEQVMKKRIVVMGVDCSSFDKAEPIQNFAKATNEAAHLAVLHGARFLDISDTDQYYSPNALTEMYDLRDSDISYFVRPLTTVMAQHPEQLVESTNLWPKLVMYYADAAFSSHILYEEHTSLSSGVLVVSKEAFRKHQYPEGGADEDLVWGWSLLDDPILRKHYLMQTNLQRNERKRMVSFDGQGERGINAIRSVFQVRQSHEPLFRNHVGQLLENDTKQEESLRSIHAQAGIPPFVDIYVALRTHFFNVNQKKREEARNIFLGIKSDGTLNPRGALVRLYDAYKGSPRATADVLIHNAELKTQQGAFFEQNPLLIPAIVQEIKKGRFKSYEAVAGFIEATLPELFAPPLSEEPSYSQAALDAIPRGEINITDWVHLHQANDYFSRFLGNLQADGEFAGYSDVVREVLEPYTPDVVTQ